MKTLNGKLWFVAAIIFIILHFTGCMTTNGRLYSGNSLPVNEVAIVVFNGDLDIESFSFGEKHIDEKLSYLRIGEILPGDYNFCVAYNVHGGNFKITSIGCGQITINAQAGHVYYVFPLSDPNFNPHSMEGAFRWQPQVIDIADDTDYEKFKDGNKVKNKVNSYLKGQRTEIEL